MSKASKELLVNVVREVPAPCRMKLDIEIPRDEVQGTIARLEVDYHKHARVPGFRPGKAPRTLLKRHYGDMIMKDVKERLVEDGVKAALAKEGITPDTRPMVDHEEDLKVNDSDSFVFSVQFDVAPEFNLPVYTGLELPPTDVEVKEEDVQDFITRLLSSRTSYEKVERAALAGDLLKATFRAHLEDGIEVPTTAKFLTEGTDTWVVLKDPELLPGITAKLVGAEAGSSHDVVIDFPADFYEQVLAGKSVNYHFDILEVHAVKTPELTDEVAKQLGAASVAEVHERVRANLAQREKTAREQARRNAVVDKLLEKVSFPIPPTRHSYQSYETLLNLYQREARNADPEKMKGRVEELRKQADEAASQQLRRHYLLAKIAEKEGIKVSSQDLTSTVEMLARMQEVTVKKMMDQLREGGRWMDLMDDILANKTIDRLIELNGGSPAGDAAAK